jgi:hypothetical protein
MTNEAFRATKPGNLLSVVPCKSFGLRPQIEFKGRKQVAAALALIALEQRAVALVDHEGRVVAHTKAYPA